jgi:hypothetical protein
MRGASVHSLRCLVYMYGMNISRLYRRPLRVAVKDITKRLRFARVPTHHAALTDEQPHGCVISQQRGDLPSTVTANDHTR